MPGRKGLPVLERFMEKVDTSGPCWLWTAGLNSSGYGHFIHNGTGKAHRVAYMLLVGPIPDGLELDHLCRVRSCVNPDHLEPVTRAVNLARSPIAVPTINASQTHCPSGHPYDEANTYIVPRDGSRQCRTCRRRQSARQAAMRKAERRARGIPSRQLTRS